MNNGCSSCHNGVYLGGNSYENLAYFIINWEYTGSKKIDEEEVNYTKDECR